MAVKKREPWKALDPYRGKEFTTEWPTFPQLIKINVERFGNNPCFTDFEGENGAKQTLTYNQVYEKIQNVAKWLIENGIQKGDHVAVTGKNSPEWAIAYLATMFASATVIPIDYALKENETQNLINASEPKIIFVDEEKYDSIKKNNPNAKIVSLSPKKDENHLYNLKIFL
jgi:long-chain acyl-CoA synthetase